MRIRRRSVLLGSMFAVVLFAQTALAGSPTPVKATNRDEFLASGNADFFSWTQNRARHPRALDVWYEPMPVGSGTPVRLNATRDKAFGGQMDASSDVLGWQRIHRGNSDVRLYDLAASMNVPLPSGIDTSKWEWAPAVNGNQMTFMRDQPTKETLFLVTNLATGHKKVIKTTDWVHSTFVRPARFYGDSIVYDVSTRRGINVFVYGISSGTTTRVPNPNHTYNFGPSVDLAGNVYFVATPSFCRGGAQLMKWDPTGGDPVAVYDLGANQEGNDTSVYDNGAGNVTIYAGILDCTTNEDDVDSFTNPTAAPMGPGSHAPGQLAPTRLGGMSNPPG